MKKREGALIMEGLFKTAMNGFRKSDVLTFIDNQEQGFRKNEQALKDKIGDLEKKIEAQKSENGESQSKINALVSELKKETEENAEIRRRFTAVMEQFEVMKNELSRNDSINSEMRREIAIHKQNSAAKNAEIAEKNAEIDKLKNTISSISTTQQRISRVMVEAQNTADKIVDTAKEEATCVICEAEKKLMLVMQQTEEFKSQSEEYSLKVDDFTQGVKEIHASLIGIAKELGAGTKGRFAESPKEESTESTEDTNPTRTPDETVAKLQEAGKDVARLGPIFNFTRHDKMFNWEKE